MHDQVLTRAMDPAIVGSDVQVVDQLEIESAIATVLMGFSTDPVARWVYPDPSDYLRWFPAFIRGFAGRAFACGTAQVTGDMGGVALWLPPGMGPDERALEKLIETTLDDKIKRDLFPVLEEMSESHPAEPHWYLPMIGVEPRLQNKGLGSALLAVAAIQLDAEGVIAYLESSNPRNIPLYERFGFEVVGEIQRGRSAPLYPMVRRPR